MVTESFDRIQPGNATPFSFLRSCSLDCFYDSIGGDIIKNNGKKKRKRGILMLQESNKWADKKHLFCNHHTKSYETR